MSMDINTHLLDHLKNVFLLLTNLFFFANIFCSLISLQQQSQAYTPQAVQKPVFQTNNASNTVRQQPSTPVYQPSPVVQQQPRNTVNASNLAQIPQVENQFVNNDNMKMEQAGMESAGSDEMTPKVFLHRTKKKASAREIRQRQNRRLRKLLTPKNALMALYELIGNKNCDFKINADAKGFLAEVLVNNVRYEGRGTSKTAAKNDASEKGMLTTINYHILPIITNKYQNSTSRFDHPKNGGTTKEATDRRC